MLHASESSSDHGGGQVLHPGGAVPEVDEGVEKPGPGVHLEQKVRQVDLRKQSPRPAPRSRVRDFGSPSATSLSTFSFSTTARASDTCRASTLNPGSNSR